MEELPYPIGEERVRDEAEAKRCNVLAIFAKIEPVSTVRFERHLRAALEKDMFDHAVVDDRGYNLLLAAMAVKNVDAMRIIANLGLWSRCVDHIVSGKSVTEMATTVIRSKAVKAALDDLVAREAELPTMCRLVRDGDLAPVIEYARDETDVVDAEGNTPLMYACMGRATNTDMLRYLVEELGASLRTVNKAERNVLHMAVSHGRQRHVRYLVGRCSLLQLVKDVDDRTPADLCAKVGDARMLRRMERAHPVDVKSLVRNAATFGSLALLKGLKYDLSQTVEGPADNSKTALHFAVANCQPHVVRYLLETLSERLSTADLREHFCTRDMFKNNVFHKVAAVVDKEHQEATFRLLLDFALKHELLGDMLRARNVYNKVNYFVLITGKDKGRPACHYVHVRRTMATLFEKKAQSGQVDVADFGDVIKSKWGRDLDPQEKTELVIEGQRASLNEDVSDATPLHLAALKDKTWMVSAMLDHRELFDINTKDRYGMTPLHVAAAKGDEATLTALMDAGANVRCVDGSYMTVCDVARANENYNIVYLMQLGDKKKGLALCFEAMTRKIDEAKATLERAREEAKGGVDPSVGLAAMRE